MTSFRELVLGLCFLGAACANNTSQPTIQWGTCAEDLGSALPVDCGRLFVPLDYNQQNSDVTLSLELLRVPAPVQPAKGSILHNFGGPGEPGRAKLVSQAPLLQILSGGEYNLIAFDPRGVGSTIPFTCYDMESDIQKFMQAQTFPNDADEVVLGRLWSRATVDSNACARKQNETGAFVSTAFVARDLMNVAEALGEDGMLRYWGFSYGTTLGATLVSMFPDKVDKVVLDGVQNPHEYYNAYADFEEWTQSDEVFSGIFKGCAANPEVCPLARDNATAEELEESVWDLFDKVRTHPIPVGNWLIDETVLHNMVAQSFYSASAWPNLTTALYMLLSGEIDEQFIIDFSGVESLEAQGTLSMSTIGIHCLDRAARAKTWDEFLPAAHLIMNTSKAMGGAAMSLSMACAQWDIDLTERYQGDFQVRTKNLILVMGNSYDAHTPIRSAHNVSSGLEGSVVLEVDGYRHTGVINPSACTFEALSNYWLNGTLPEPGTVCKVDAPLFSNITWDDVIEKITGKSAT